VRFYTTATFSTDNAFQLDDVEIDQVAAFLRAINALENVRNASVLAEDAQRQPPEQALQTIEVMMADTEDAIEVLSGGPLAPLYPDAVADLQDAYGLAEDAHRAEQPGLRNASLRQALNLLRQIPDLILQSEEEPEVSDGDRPAEDRADGDAGVTSVGNPAG
jgi:hypothetical protein